MIALLLPSPAIAGAITISACTIERRETVQSIIYCDVENKSDRAVATLVFRAIFKSPDREVPWAEIGNDWSKGRALVRGGIEPGETVRTLISPVSLDSRSDGLPLEVAFLEAQFLDVNGDQIGETIGNEKPRPQSMVDKALSGALSQD
ncbi:MAG: hypothetical protein CMN18_02540 [Roseovarius sp.]|nr:hypothetical protein [Roseovarius sp.]MBD11569.1 hypothetical protein [Roseovarius sp.]|tara:strand:+ start:1060 stop:1503 length:444 start_codon:yes stop_codon:yes gene_type:complete